LWRGGWRGAHSHTIAPRNYSKFNVKISVLLVISWPAIPVQSGAELAPCEKNWGQRKTTYLFFSLGFLHNFHTETIGFSLCKFKIFPHFNDHTRGYW